MADVEITEREEWEIEAEKAIQSLSRKKALTILAVVAAKAQGKKLREVFADPDKRPCNMEVYWRWQREDAEFRNAYAIVEKIAFSHADRTAIGELRNARQGAGVTRQNTQ